MTKKPIKVSELVISWGLTIGTQKVALILVVLLLFPGYLQFCFANVFPDPSPDLPRIYIRNDGSIEPPTAPIEKTGSIYTLTDNIVLYTVEVQCDNIVIDGSGYTIQGNASRIKGHDEGNNGVIIEKQNNVTITRVNFEQGDTGVRVSSSSNISITDNTFTDRLTTGISATDSSYIIIENNSFSNVGKLDYFGSQAILCNGRFNIIKGNNITDTGNGINLEGYANTISNNKIEATNAIRMSKADSNMITRNKISGRTNESEPDVTTTNDGIWVFADCSDNIIYGNEITGFSSNAIRITYGSNNTVSSNYFANNEFAIDIDGDSTDTKVYGNTFTVDSRKIEIYEVEDTKWDNGTTGNYWSDYNGTDLDGDGIGDTPYTVKVYTWDSDIDGYVSYDSGQDNYPLIEPQAIPEFPSCTSLLVMLLAAVGVTVIYKKRLLITVDSYHMGN